MSSGPGAVAPLVGMVWAQASNGVIGRDGAVPWHLPEDMAHFREVTRGATVVMGRRTWESLPERFRPLPGRRNVVLTTAPGWASDGARAAGSLEAALGLAGGDDVWVIGGAAVYAAAMDRAQVLEVTELADPVEGDVRAPGIGPEWELVAVRPASGWLTSTTGLRHRFLRHRRQEEPPLRRA